MKRLTVLLTLAALAAWGQEKKTDEPKDRVQLVQKILEVKHADVNRVAGLVGILGATVKADPTLRVIAVNGAKETVAAIEEAVKRLDVPSTALNVELTFHLVYASTKGDAGPETAEIAPAIKQLRGIFAYKGYRVVETLILRGRDGQGGSTTGNVFWPDGEAGRRVRYMLEYRSASVASSSGNRILRIDSLILNLPDNNSGIRTDVDVREGQKVVVGKSNISGSVDALILIVTAKVVE
jgi:hypothetical protein